MRLWRGRGQPDHEVRVTTTSTQQCAQAAARDVMVGEPDHIVHGAVSLALGADLSYARSFGNALDALPPR
jgi:hypothetical protein